MGIYGADAAEALVESSVEGIFGRERAAWGRWCCGGSGLVASCGCAGARGVWAEARGGVGGGEFARGGAGGFGGCRAHVEDLDSFGFELGKKMFEVWDIRISWGT